MGVSVYEMVWTRRVQGDEGEVDLEGVEGRADAFATSKRLEEHYSKRN